MWNGKIGGKRRIQEEERVTQPEMQFKSYRK
jgi:hypothetical protein